MDVCAQIDQHSLQLVGLNLIYRWNPIHIHSQSCRFFCFKAHAGILEEKEASQMQTAEFNSSSSNRIGSETDQNKWLRTKVQMLYLLKLFANKSNNVMNKSTRCSHGVTESEDVQKISWWSAISARVCVEWVQTHWTRRIKIILTHIISYFVVVSIPLNSKWPTYYCQTMHIFLPNEHMNGIAQKMKYSVKILKYRKPICQLENYYPKRMSREFGIVVTLSTSVTVFHDSNHNGSMPYHTISIIILNSCSITYFLV